MKYISTRGGITPISFKRAVMMGLATDGGLLLPEFIPLLSDTTVRSWQEAQSRNELTYQQLAFDILSLFATDIPAEELRKLIDRSYAVFSHPAVTPVIRQDDLYILELFHGPTLAFKDVALQFLGNVFEYILQESGGKMNILGATSGDTGSAAIYGVRGKERISIFILHPHGRVSRIQELQMTTVLDENVFNLAIKGTFDHGQAIVKKLFNDIAFKEEFHLGAINSINWARILAQVVYYVSAWLAVSGGSESGEVDFSVPTGNFGDIFAGFVAKKMLGPGRIRTLILATNENDLLSRFVTRGDYSLGTVVPTSSPSMDIQVASNFERYLYYLLDQDPELTRQKMEEFAQTGALRFDSGQQQQIREVFAARKVSEPEIRKTIGDFYRKCGYTLDPHTAVGVCAAQSLKKDDVPMVCLATAHPAKFGEVVEEAIGVSLTMPPELAGLSEKQCRCKVVVADAEVIKRFVVDHAC